MQRCRGEGGHYHVSSLCYANSFHTGAQDLFIPIPEWIMPDLKQSILQTVAEWAGSMTYWGSNCPLMVTETESPVWSMPQRWSEIPMLAWEKKKGLQAVLAIYAPWCREICHEIRHCLSPVELNLSSWKQQLTVTCHNHMKMQHYQYCNDPCLKINLRSFCWKQRSMEKKPKKQGASQIMEKVTAQKRNPAKVGVLGRSF